MGEQMAEFDAIPYCIRIGVTGHRKLDDAAAIEELVKRAIDDNVCDLFPAQARQEMEGARRGGTKAITFSILSPLAEGADRLVARAVLGYPGARLVAVLPLVVEDYLEDFVTEESRREFQELLSPCAETVFLRAGRIQDESRNPDALAELRREAYAAAGRYVVDHCDLLIAVWDGKPSASRGGTAEIVRYAIQKNRPILRVWGDSS